MGLKKNQKEITFFPELSVHYPRMIIDSNREIVVEGCRGILAYSNQLVHIRADKMELKFKGRNLELKSLTPENLLVFGELFCIEYVNIK